MDNKKYFKSTNYRVPDVIKPNQKQIPVEWFFAELNKEDIAKHEDGSYAIMPSCGCTVKIDVTDSKIKALYNDSTSYDDVVKSTNREKNISKTLRVYLNDGQPLMIRNNKGVLKPNTQGKKNLLITFNVIVQA